MGETPRRRLLRKSKIPKVPSSAGVFLFVVVLTFVILTHTHTHTHTHVKTKRPTQGSSSSQAYVRVFAVGLICYFRKKSIFPFSRPSSLHGLALLSIVLTTSTCNKHVLGVVILPNWLDLVANTNISDCKLKSCC